MSYSILPSPHFVVKNTKIFNTEDEKNELGQIKNLKIFIYQGNFLNQKNIEIKRILLEKANFFISIEDFKFFDNFFSSKFSEKKIRIKNSKLFYKDKDDKTISIFPISNSRLYYDIRNNRNEVIANGKLFQVPTNIKYIKDTKNNKNSIFQMNMNKLNLEMKNISDETNQFYTAVNELVIKNSKFITNYSKKDSLVTISSKDSKLGFSNLDYKGMINLDPFDFSFDINLEKLDLYRFIFSNLVLEEALKINSIYNKNLSGKISLNVEELIKNKLFNSGQIFLGFTNGDLNFDNSYLLNKKIGLMTFLKSNLVSRNGEVILRSTVKFNILNQKNFFKVFQVPKKKRTSLKNIFFEFEYNMFKGQLMITDLSLKKDYKELINNDEMILFDFGKNQKNKNEKWVTLKKFINVFFENYSG